jgi:hypothetical protein
MMVKYVLKYYPQNSQSKKGRVYEVVECGIDEVKAMLSEYTIVRTKYDNYGVYSIKETFRPCKDCPEVTEIIGYVNRVWTS